MAPNIVGVTPGQGSHTFILDRQHDRLYNPPYPFFPDAVASLPDIRPLANGYVKADAVMPAKPPPRN
jgi:hypothetical protein